MSKKGKTFQNEFFDQRYSGGPPEPVKRVLREPGPDFDVSVQRNRFAETRPRSQSERGPNRLEKSGHDEDQVGPEHHFAKHGLGGVVPAAVQHQSEQTSFGNFPLYFTIYF